MVCNLILTCALIKLLILQKLISFVATICTQWLETALELQYNYFSFAEVFPSLNESITNMYYKSVLSGVLENEPSNKVAIAAMITFNVIN